MLIFLYRYKKIIIKKVLQVLSLCFHFVKKNHTAGVLPTMEHFSSKPVFTALARVLLLTGEMLHIREYYNTFLR